MPVFTLSRTSSALPWGSVSSMRTCASFSSAEVMTPFSYETWAICTLSRASSSAFCCVDTTSTAACSVVQAVSSSSRA